jgi:hypothetical protein
MDSQIEVEGKIDEINDRVPVAGCGYEPGDDGDIEPLPPTATEVLEHLPDSPFSGYVGLLRNN